MMSYWQFLIQKEGEGKWQQLNSVNGTIEAGKYRIVAQCYFPDLEIEIKITHQTIKVDGTVVNRSRQRLRNTNSDGFLVILPFTNLELGKLNISCSSPSISELLNEPWSENLTLAISESQDLSNLTEQTEVKSSISVDSLLEDSLSNLKQLLNQDVAIGSTNIHNSDDLHLKLSLNQNHFSVTPGAYLLLSGSVEVNEIEQQLPLNFTGRLRYQIYDNKTGNIILEEQKYLSKEKLPIVFNYLINLPLDKYQSTKHKYILGKVILETYDLVLAEQKFTIELDMKDFNKYYKSPTSNHLKLFTINPINREFTTSSGQVLPPKIIRNSDHKKAVKLPPLPEFSELEIKEKCSHPDVIPAFVYQDLSQEQSPTITDKIKPDPVDEKFKALPVKERFLSNLNSLTVDS